MTAQFLLRQWHRNRERNTDLLDVAAKTLDKMAAGGIYDHLAGGFARYSVDAHWLVPHFEKMLYDNALLCDAYVDAFAATGNEAYGRVAREICDYILKYMTDEKGGFHSTEDADSEGEEGKFYVWTVDEIKDILGAEAAEKFCYAFDITDGGNFEGKNIPNLPKTLEQVAQIKQWDLESLCTELESSKEKLLEVRDQRVRPGKDDKILASWNGLMIHSMARTGAVLDQPHFVDAAVRAAEFVLRDMTKDDGRLLHTYRHGTAKLDAYLDDYANMANALVTLYETTFDDRWIDAAVQTADVMLKHFFDSEGGGFFYTADDHEQLIARMKDLQDNSIPSGNAMAATVLQRLGYLCNRDDYLDAAAKTLQMAASIMNQYPIAVGQMLIAADLHLGPVKQLVIAETENNEHSKRIRQRYLPNIVLASPSSNANLQSLVNEKTASDGKARLYVCEQFTCQQPIEEADLAAAIEEMQ